MLQHTHTHTHTHTHIHTHTHTHTHTHRHFAPCCNTTFYTQINGGNSFGSLMFWNPQVSNSMCIQTERVANTGTTKNKFITFSAGVLCRTQPSGEICPMPSSNWGCSKMYYGSVNSSLGTGLIPAIGHHPQNDGNTVRSDTHTGWVMTDSPTYSEADLPGKPPNVIFVLVTRICITCVPHQILFGWCNQEQWDGRGM